MVLKPSEALRGSPVGEGGGTRHKGADCFPVARSGQPALRALVVDDAPTTCALFSGMLTREGMAVRVATTGKQALSMASEEPLDLILLDYQLPDMNGASVARQLRLRPALREVPIILVTASSLESTMEEAFTAGADDYLIKPVARPLLLARAGAAMRARDSRIAARSADAMLHDLQEARQVQQSLLPPLPVKWDGWHITGAVVPCSMVGGDMLDVMPGMEGRKVVSLVDVSGHGMAAALVAAQVCSELRMLVETRPLAEAMMALGMHMCHRGGERYACVAAVEINGGSVTIINAGLPPVCVLRAGVVRELISASAIPPGLFDNPEVSPTHLVLEPGDCLVLLSDGMTEPFGRADNVLPALAVLGRRLQVPAPKTLAQRMQKLVGEQQSDDATLLVLSREAPAATQG